MKKDSIWSNQAFCFRISVVSVFVWLTLSSTISMIIYFSFSDNIIEDVILEFSTWFFIIPAITSFGLINAIPLMLDWLLEPFENTESTTVNKTKNVKSTSYSQLSSRLENPNAE